MKRKTAAEFLSELESDSDWTNQRAIRERSVNERAATHAADERELVAEIRDAGYDIDSVYDLVNNEPHPVLARRFIGPYPAAYSSLIRHLSIPHLPAIREGIVRALTVKDGGSEVEAALLAAFAGETDPHLRFVLANALRTAMPYQRRKKYPEIGAALKETKRDSSAPPSNTR
ncbi:MAG TPA: hypothetical protein VF042_03510 [Gemmatimonadaceae bacterium]